MLTLLTWIILTITSRSTPHQSMQQMIDSGHTLYISDSAYCSSRKLIAVHSFNKAGSYIAKLKTGDIIRISNACTYKVESVKKVKTEETSASIFNKSTLFLQTCSKRKWRTIIIETTQI